MTTADFGELHDELRAVARDVLGKEGTLDTPWSLLARAGWTGLEVDDAFGGAGAGFGEVAIICTELGRTLTGSRYLGSAVLAVAALAAVGPNAGRDEMLCGIAGGEMTAAVAFSADHESIGAAAPFTLTTSSGQLVLEGASHFVADAAGVDRLLLLAEDPAGAPMLVAIAPGDLRVDLTPVFDESRRFASVSANHTVISAAAVWPVIGDPEAWYERAACAIACDSLGVAEAMLAATVDYATVRQQFGRPIGSFQAVKHALADMLVQISVTRRLVAAAVDAVAVGGPDTARTVSMAKSYATETAVAVAGKAMQLHGGIGYTWESGIHRYLKRAMLNRALFGSPPAHRRRIAAAY